MVTVDGIIDEAEYVWTKRLEPTHGCLHNWQNRAPRMLAMFAVILSACFGAVNPQWSVRLETNGRNWPSGLQLQDGRREGFIDLDLTRSRLTLKDSSTGETIGAVSTVGGYTEAPDLLARAAHRFFASGQETADDAAD